MPKISIYVPDDMKARMDEAGERANWSATAQRAFEVELNHVEQVKEVKSMEDVIARLRSSKEKNVERLEKEGRECGVEWAKHRAEYGELKRAAQIDREALARSCEIEGYDALNRARTAVQILRDPDWDALDRTERESAMIELFGIDRDMLEAVVTTEFVIGFLEGASDVWDEIGNQI